MDDREKLVELLQSAPADIMGNHGVGALADHLIYHGVTVQSERMEDAVPVVRCKDCIHSYDDLCGLSCTCGPYVD